MKRYTELSRKYLSRRKRRTVYTFLGVTLAVAFIAAIMIMFDSIEASQLRSLKTVTGAYHGKIVSVDDLEITSLQAHVYVKDLGIQKILHEIDISGENTKIIIDEAEEISIALRGKTVKEGRLPNKAGEIALDTFAVELLGIPQQIGQQVSLEIDGEVSVFELVGLVSTSLQEKRSGKAFASISPQESAVLSTRLAVNQIAFYTVDAENDELREHSQKVAADLGMTDRATYNGSLIYYLENQPPVNWAALILGILVAIASAVSIYNTVHISVLERIREFGLLRAAGATSSQIKRIVVRESLIVSAVSIPAGLALGVILSFGVGVYAGAEMTGLDGMTTSITPLALVLSSVLGFLSVLISSFVPSLRAGKISPVEAMRQYGVEFRERAKKDISSKGVIPDKSLQLKLALRNMRRNLGTTVVSVVSMTIAATLFIGFSYFISNFDTDKLTRAVTRSDFSIRAVSTYDDGPDKETIEEIYSIDGVELVAAARFITGRLLTEETLSNTANTSSSDAVVVGSPEAALRQRSADDVGLGLGLLAYNDSGIEYMKQKLISGEIDSESLAKEPSLIIDHENSVRYGLSVGDIVTIRTYYLTEGMVRRSIDNVFAVAAVVQEFPSIAYAVAGGIIVACSEHVLDIFWPDAENVTFTAMSHIDNYAYVDVFLSEEASNEDVSIQVESIAHRYRNARFVSYQEYLKELESSIRTLSSLVYGLIAIVAFIGICGITNTVNTNLILRQREFGMLRATGMTRGQLKKMLGYEGLIFGLVSAVCSVILGLLLSYSIFYLFRQEIGHLNWSMPWIGMVVAAVGVVAAGTLTTLVSSRRITSMNIIEAIRTVE